MNIINAADDTIVITNINADERKDLLALAANRKVQPQLLTRSEVAEILRCHPKTVERHAKLGLIRQIHIGRRQVRYDAAEIAELARNGNSLATVGGKDRQTKGVLESKSVEVTKCLA